MTERAFVPVRIAVLTVSDTRTAADDRSGDTLVERLTAAGHRLAGRTIVEDDQAAIEARLRAWIADEAKTDKSEAGSGHSGMGGVQINILNALAEPPKQVQLVDLRAKA